MIKYEDIKRANDEIKTTTITRYDKKSGKEISKEYAEVNERIKAFKKIYPEGCIYTELLSNEFSNADGSMICIFKAKIYAANDATVNSLLATGHAYEKEGSSFINQTSYIENCETSAVGRALGMAGFGIDTSVASYEEVKNAISNQPADKKDIKIIKQMAEEYNKEIADICKAYKITALEDMTKAQYADCLKQFQKIKEKK